mgnify:CR=1 FL=1
MFRNPIDFVSGLMRSNSRERLSRFAPTRAEVERAADALFGPSVLEVYRMHGQWHVATVPLDESHWPAERWNFRAVRDYDGDGVDFVQVF